MLKRLHTPPFTRTDKLCLVAIAGVLIATTLVYELTDGAALRQAQREDKPKPTAEERIPLQVDPMVFYGETPTATLLPPAINDSALIAAELIQDALLYDPSIPMSAGLQAVLREACEANNVPMCLALGLIEVESNFQVDAVSTEVCVGLFQLNSKYYPADLTPAENIQTGVAHLAGQIERYDGDIQAALRAYNLGYDDGDRRYAKAVLDALEKWGNG